MTGVCGHLPGVTCSNCRLASDDRWATPQPSDLPRIADALEKLVDVLTSDRYATNEERQREELQQINDTLDEVKPSEPQDVIRDAGLPEVLLCPECGHGIDEHRVIDHSTTWCAGSGLVCPCRMYPSAIARHWIAPRG